jgi:hypothetical protein
MGTLASELRPIAADLAARPRVYADANLPAGLVDSLRQDLDWAARPTSRTIAAPSTSAGP